jgi:signal transduction histidine kinase
LPPPSWLNADSPREADPAWALGQECADPAGTPGCDLRLVARSHWWPPASLRARGALDRLWRYATGLAWIAREIASADGGCDPDRVARLAVLHPLGLWALAAVSPEDLADWLEIDDPAARHDWEARRLGDDPSWLGKQLAERWGGSSALVAATWVPAEPSSWTTIDPADRTLLVTLQRARRRVNRSPLALAGPPPVGPVPPVHELKRWIAGRQGWCGSTLAPALAAPTEETLVRSHARLLLELRQQQSRLASATAFVEAVAKSNSSTLSDQPEISTLEAARSVWNSTLAENERLGAALRHSRQKTSIAPAARSPSQLLDAMAEFAAGAGHELNNPLAVIMGRAQLLLSRLPDPDVQRSLRVIVGQTQRAHRMLRDLMFVARPGIARNRPSQPEDLVRRTLEDLRAEAEARDVRLAFETTGTRAMASTDPDHLRHLIEVLVRNALEAAPAGSTVTTRVKRADGMLIVQVADQGTGLTPDEERHLLVPFFCGRQAGRGLGLGLSRVTRYLTSIAGTLNWSTHPGGGTLFTARLPIVPISDRNVA